MFTVSFRIYFEWDGTGSGRFIIGCGAHDAQRLGRGHSQLDTEEAALILTRADYVDSTVTMDTRRAAMPGTDLPA